MRLTKRPLIVIRNDFPINAGVLQITEHLLLKSVGIVLR